MRKLAAAICIAVSPLALAGPLSPPAGPVSPTGPTVIDALPYTITDSGSYVLTGNLTGVVGNPGIQVNASDVTIDLNGFTLRGVAGSGGGIETQFFPPTSNLTIHNGTITEWGAAGINASSASECRLTDLTITFNGERGASVGGGSIISRCNANNNGQSGPGLFSGFVVGSNSVVSDSVSGQNEVGFSASANTTFLNCNAYSNTVGFSGGQSSTFENCVADSSASYGFEAGDGSVYLNCAASYNDDHGFFGLKSNSFTNCSAFNNLGDGFHTTDNASFDSCVAEANVNGFATFLGASIEGCASRLNNFAGYFVSNGSLIIDSTATSNGTLGFSGFLDVTVRGCTADGNGSHGINLLDGSVVEDSTSSNNTGHGIFLANRGRVSNSRANSNGDSGITVGDGAVIDRSIVDSNTLFGINAGDRVHITDSVIRNTVSGSGILALNQATLERTTSHANAGSGITALNEARIVGCDLQSNVNNGVVVLSQGDIRDNYCAVNGEYGIHAQNEATIVGNTLTNNGSGVAPISRYTGIYVNDECLIRDNDITATSIEQACIHLFGDTNDVYRNHMRYTGPFLTELYIFDNGVGNRIATPVFLADGIDPIANIKSD